METSNPMPRFIETSDLLLRPWGTTDADSLFQVANDDEVARMTGWEVHTSPEYSRRVITDILHDDYAIIPKVYRRAAGSIGMKYGDRTNFPIGEDECELGYWIGREFWNRGYVTQAAKALIAATFQRTNVKGIWCICLLDNPASARVQDKCGFSFVRNGEIDDPIYGVKEMRFTYLSRSSFEGMKGYSTILMMDETY